MGQNAYLSICNQFTCLAQDSKAPSGHPESALQEEGEQAFQRFHLQTCSHEYHLECHYNSINLLSKNKLDISVTLAEG